MSWESQNTYFSGQGVLLIAQRNAAGKPQGFVPVGNVSAASIAVETTVEEHKESQTGQRGIDARLQTETNATLSYTLENFNAKNLADALRATPKSVAAGAVAAEAVCVFPGKISSLSSVRVSAVAIAGYTAYTDEITPFDYEVNAEAGSIRWNDGSSVALATAGTAPVAITVGATTQLELTGHGLVVGQSIFLHGFTGADAASLNVGSVTVASVVDVDNITVAIDTTAETITGGLVIVEGAEVNVAYTREAQEIVEALTEGAKDVFVRFEGLNTADENKPVVIEAFRVSVDPLQELALISDTFQQFEVEGSVLADATRPSGTSQYFKVTTLS